MFSKCPYCGASERHRSRRRTFLEKHFLPLFAVKPVRCASCFRRSLRVLAPARVLISMALLAGCIALLAMRFSLAQKSDHATADEALQKNADVLERQVRQELPVGSP